MGPASLRGTAAGARPAPGNDLDRPGWLVYAAGMRTPAPSPPRDGHARPDRPQSDRAARLKSALKANIARRKAQARARTGAADDTAPGSED